MTGQGTPEHLGVVLLSGLGDVVHGLVAVNAVRDAWPETRITWITEPMPSGILAHHPSIDRIVVFRRKEGLRGLRLLRRELAAGPPIDLTLNFNVYLKSVFPTLMTGAGRRVGFDRGRSFEGVWLACTETLPPRPRAHTADMFLEFVGHLGLPVADPEWRIRFTEEELAEREAFLDRIGKPIATVIPASASHKKDWTVEGWATVVDSLSADFGFNVVIAGGPGEREGRIADAISSKASRKPTLAMGDSVRRLAWILSASDLVIAPDTGPVHIARALSVPVIGLFGHTNPWRVGPWRVYEDLWVDHYTDPEKGPDPSNRTPKWDVMHTITADEVIAKVQRAVDVYRVGRG